jgi:hypothetical protein
VLKNRLFTQSIREAGLQIIDLAVRNPGLGCFVRQVFPDQVYPLRGGLLTAMVGALASFEILSFSAGAMR